MYKERNYNKLTNLEDLFKCNKLSLTIASPEQPHDHYQEEPPFYTTESQHVWHIVIDLKLNVKFLALFIDNRKSELAHTHIAHVKIKNILSPCHVLCKQTPKL